MWPWCCRSSSVPGLRGQPQGVLQSAAFELDSFPRRHAPLRCCWLPCRGGSQRAHRFSRVGFLGNCGAHRHGMTLSNQRVGRLAARCGPQLLIQRSWLKRWAAPAPRLIRGAVVDWLDMHVAAYHWPAFNQADVGITLDVAVWVLSSLARTRRLASTSHRS